MAPHRDKSQSPSGGLGDGGGGGRDGPAGGGRQQHLSREGADVTRLHLDHRDAAHVVLHSWTTQHGVSNRGGQT